ncbi:MAG: GntR family transcriptional regulator [Candidatus Dormibacteraeota bacterium]|jgi:DNA-binding GntR family transcriptional regulator|nr:GntR family transcriptional regulator [Candidatus Dormibacteraeota bacterium]
MSRWIAGEGGVAKDGRGELTGPVAIKRPSRLAEAAADQLRGLIFGGQLPPGSVLRQEELAGRLGISRTPLRESLRLLEVEGLVETPVTGGSRVVDLAGEAAREMMEVREVIDGLVGRLWARRGLAESQRAAFTKMLDEMDRASVRGEKKAYMVTNAAFHVGLLRGLEHRWLDQFGSLVRMSSQATYLHLDEGEERLLRSAREHRSILDAIVNREEELAERLARQHVVNALRHWVVERPAAATARP